MRSILIATLAASLMLSACTGKKAEDAPDEPAATPSPAEPVSIIRPDIEEARMVPLEPLEVTIGFADSGEELTDGAIAQLEELLASRQLEAGGTITIGGHSDSGGSDAANMRASQNRADAVRDWLVAKGVAENRLVTIAFGEQNPVAKNALPTGEPDEAGRAANRRAEVRIDVPEGMMVEEEAKSVADVVVQATGNANEVSATD